MNVDLSRAVGVLIKMPPLNELAGDGRRAFIDDVMDVVEADGGLDDLEERHLEMLVEAEEGNADLLEDVDYPRLETLS